jgi:UDP-GlcNAc3NAcA epimerase
MKLLSVIGTRPQYIKIKPFYDFCLKNRIPHKIVDTLQHYSHNVSGALIEDLKLKIDFSLKVKNSGEIAFLADSLLQLEEIFKGRPPDFVLVYGDTNSTLAASMVCYKMGIPFAHVEAGLRCGDIHVPEEVNRIFADSVSRIRFCSSNKVVEHNNNVFCGDLEYELLNNINPSIKFQDYGVMTIHRQSNINLERLSNIIDFCARIPIDIKFFVHHRTLPTLKKLEIPTNIQIYESCAYSEMVKNLAECKFIITDSGGINKTAPFFGKKALVLREKIEWTATEARGHAKRSQLTTEDINWLLDSPKPREKRFYLGVKNPSYIIYNTIKRYLDDSII